MRATLQSDLLEVRVLSLLGIRPTQAAGSIGPAGNHLRWAFDAELGFPTAGFRLHRRDAGAKFPFAVGLDAVPVGASVPGGDLDGVRFSFPVGGGLTGAGTAGLRTNPRSAATRLELRFAEPVARLSMQLDAPGALGVRAFAGDRPATSVTLAAAAGTAGVDLEWPGITRVELPLDFHRLRQLAVVTVAQVRRGDDLGWGPPRATLDAIGDSASVTMRLEPGLRNRYAANEQDAIARYQPAAGQLVELLDAVRNPTVPPFDRVDVPPHRLTMQGDPQQPLSRLRPLPLLLLAALDPNVARILGLYWVDRDGTADGPRPGAAYDYLVEGLWGADTHVGLVFGVGARIAGLPQVSGPVSAGQLPGFDWRDRTPLARVGLRWGHPPAPADAAPPPEQTVLYDVARLEGSNLLPLTADAPVLVTETSWTSGEAPLFRESGVGLGQARYAVAGIDIFGQRGPHVASDALELVDREPPPPPVRVRADLVRGGRAAAVDFEYGLAQRLLGSDARRAQCYARRDGLVDTLPVRIEVVKSTEVLQQRPVGWRHVLRLRAMDGGALPADTLRSNGAPRYHMLRVTHDVADERRALADRRGYRIDDVLDGGRIAVASSERQVAEGVGELVSDPAARQLWQRIGPETALVQPVRTSFQRSGRTLALRIREVRDLAEAAGPLAQLPPDRRPPDTATAAVRELTVDIALLDAGIFDGGTAEVDGHEAAVLYQTAGSANGARVAVPADFAATAGQILELTLAPAQVERYRVVELLGSWPVRTPRDRGGEAAFVLADGDRAAARVGRLASGVTTIGSTITSLIDAGATESWLDLIAAGADCELSVPYRIEVPVGAGGLDLTSAPGQLARSAYLAVTAEDDRGNEGSLSAPALIVAVRPAPAGAPGIPHACTGTAADPAGYATPPDGRGRATLCLAWDEGTLNITDGLRWEVARALDTSLVAVHRREWSAGRLEVSAPVVRGAITTAIVGQVGAGPPGLFRVRAELSGPLDSADVRGARLRQGAEHWAVTSYAVPSGGVLDLIVRPSAPGRSGPDPGDADLEQAPNYSAVLADDVALRMLAASLPDAFALVTGTPVGGPTYRDELPGTGRNRFFYRVRAVDPAQQPSAWSPVSAPMHLVDTTPPAAPAPLYALGGERRATLTWPRDPDERVTNYRVHRGRTAAELAVLGALPVHAEVAASAGPTVEWIDERLEGTLGPERYVYRVTAVKTVRTGPADAVPVLSLPTAAVSVPVLDTSVPEPAVWVSAGWEAPEGAPPRVRLEWQSDESQFTLERRAEDALWHRLNDVATETGNLSLVARDPTADPTRVNRYRIAVTNRFGRSSMERPEIRVEALVIV